MADIRVDFVDTTEIRRASNDIREVGAVLKKAAVACMEVAQATNAPKFIDAAEVHANAAKTLTSVAEKTADSMESLAKRYDNVEESI